MSSLTNISNVCRTCLAQFTVKAEFVHLDFLESAMDSLTIRQKLQIFAPELDLGGDFSSVICMECAAAVEFVHEFKKKCLKAEEYIQSLNHLSSGQPEEATVKREDEGSFFQIVAVQSLSADVRAKTIMSENGESTDSSLLKSEHEQNKNEPLLQVVDLNSVLFNTQNDVGIEEEFFRRRDSTDSLSMDGFADARINEVVLEDNHGMLNNNIDTQCNYTTFETFNKVRHKFVVLYKCNQCSFSVTREFPLTVQIKTHLSQLYYECDQGGWESSLKTILIAHIQRHRKDQPFKCKKCAFATALVSRIVVRKKTRTCSKLFSCIKCGYETENTTDFEAHLGDHIKKINLHDSENCVF